MAATATIRVVSGSDIYAAGILDDVAERIGEAAHYASLELRGALTTLADQAKSIAVIAKSVTGAQPDAETEHDRAEREAEEDAVRPTAATTAEARNRVARLDQLFRVAARTNRPCSFRLEQLLVDAQAVEAALAGYHVKLHPQDRVYLYARIAVLGGVRAVDFRRIATAVDTKPDTFERTYRRYWKAMADLRELAAGPVPAKDQAASRADA